MSKHYILLSNVPLKIDSLLETNLRGSSLLNPSKLVNGQKCINLNTMALCDVAILTVQKNNLDTDRVQ